MFYAEGIVYPHDAKGEEITHSLGFVNAVAFDIRTKHREMVGMPVRLCGKEIGHVLQVYFDASQNLCVLMQIELWSKELTHIQVGYAFSFSSSGVVSKVSNFFCELGDWQHALFKTCTFSIVPLEKYKRRYFRDNVLLYS